MVVVVYPEKVLRKLKHEPVKMMENAFKGIEQDLAELANYWNEEATSLLPLGVLDVFFRHLLPDKTPPRITSLILEQDECRNANLSLVGLTKLGNFLPDEAEAEPYDPILLKAWPGIFKWCSYFYASYVEPIEADPAKRKHNVDLIGAVWYSICRTDRIREAMATTAGSIEIATRIWVLEDDDSAAPLTNLPTATAALDALIKHDSEDLQDRMVHAAVGKVEHVAKIALTRLRRSVKDIAHFNEPPTIVHLHLVLHMCMVRRDHPVRHALLANGAITLCTTIALTSSRLLMSTPDPHPRLLKIMSAAFSYLFNFLETSDGFTWVTQSIKAGLLGAIVDNSPFFPQLDVEDQEMILDLTQVTLSKYLVYRSVIQAADSSMRALRLKEPPRSQRIGNSTIKDAWRTFENLFTQRLEFVNTLRAEKGKVEACDNPKCQKMDERNNFRKCAACQTTLYCSKECQTVAWKEGGHRTMCALKQQERLEGKSSPILKSDMSFWHQLAAREATRELGQIGRIAVAKYPDIPKNELVIHIDFTVTPSALSVFPLAEFEEWMPRTDGSQNSLARNDAIIERVRENKTAYTAIFSEVANGHLPQMIMTLATNIWPAPCIHQVQAKFLENMRIQESLRRLRLG